MLQDCHYLSPTPPRLQITLDDPDDWTRLVAAGQRAQKKARLVPAIGVLVHINTRICQQTKIEKGTKREKKLRT